MITMVSGSIFNSKMQTIVNPVNCVGVMGKGLALQFKDRYPQMFAEYRRQCSQNRLRPGILQLHCLPNGKNIINFPTKMHWHNSSRIDYIISGMDYLVRNYQRWQITSIAFPPLGCGCGGLDWTLVEKIITSKLEQMDIPAEIYVPFHNR